MRGGGRLRGLSQWVWVQLCTWSPNKLWRSNSIFNTYGSSWQMNRGNVYCTYTTGVGTRFGTYSVINPGFWLGNGAQVWVIIPGLIIRVRVVHRCHNRCIASHLCQYPRPPSPPPTPTSVSAPGGFTKRCRPSWLTNSALVYGGSDGVSANEYSCTQEPEYINFGDLTPYLTMLCSFNFVSNPALQFVADPHHLHADPDPWSHSVSMSTKCGSGSGSVKMKRIRIRTSVIECLCTFFVCSSECFSAVGFLSLHHRVDRVLDFFSGRPNWDPHPSPAGECPPPLWFQVGVHTILRESGRGGPNSNEGIDTMVLCALPTSFIYITISSKYLCDLIFHCLLFCYSTVYIFSILYQCPIVIFLELSTFPLLNFKLCLLRLPTISPAASYSSHSVQQAHSSVFASFSSSLRTLSVFLSWFWFCLVYLRGTLRGVR